MEKNIPGRGTFQGGKANTLSHTPPYLPPSQDPEKEICPVLPRALPWGKEPLVIPESPCVCGKPALPPAFALCRLLLGDL